jgi:hypothetical protein
LPDITTSYINASYFLFTTASTNGYGDITVDNKSTEKVEGRYLFAILIMLLSLIFFAYLQSVISKLRLDWILAETKVNQEMDDFDDWMAVRTQTPGVVITYKYDKSIREFFYYLYHLDVYTALSSSGFIDLMHSQYKEMICDCASSFIIQGFTFFEELPPEVSTQIVLEMTPVR